MRKSLPMRGRRNAAKRIKLAESINRPEYFQREINALTKTQSQQENNDAQDSHEENSQEVSTRQEGSTKTKVKHRKVVQEKGLLD